MTRPRDGGSPLTPAPSSNDALPWPPRIRFPAEVAARLDGFSAHTTPTGDVLRGPHGIDLAMTPLRRRPGWRVIPLFADPALARVAARPTLPVEIQVPDRDPARAATRIARRLLPAAELAAYVRRLDLLLDAVTQAAARSPKATARTRPRGPRAEPSRSDIDQESTAAWPYLEFVLDHAAPVLDRIRELAPQAAGRDPHLWLAFDALHAMTRVLRDGRELRDHFEAVTAMILPDHPRTDEVRARARRLRAKDAEPLLDQLDAYREDFARLAHAVARPVEHTHHGLHTPHILGWEWLLAQGPHAPFSDRHIGELWRHWAPLAVLATTPTPPGWDGGLPGTAIVARTNTGAHLALHVRPDHSGETALWHATNCTLDSAATLLAQRFGADRTELADQATAATARLVLPTLTPLAARPAPRRATALAPTTRDGRRR